MNSPTLAPQGSGSTPTIRFHDNLRISVKNVTLGTSEGTRVTRKPRNGRIEARSRNYPLAPINRGLSLLKNFHRSLTFSRTLAFTFSRKSTSRAGVYGFRSFSDFPTVLLPLLLGYCFCFSSYLYYLFCDFYLQMSPCYFLRMFLTCITAE
jgi:hypothetical protein